VNDTAFEQHRPLLIGLAYRLLGSMWDAEDVVQDAYLRWMRTDRVEVREPRAYLITVVTRIALDQLRSARVNRAAYVGPWLPEPAETDTLGPLDTAEQRDTVAFATVHLMERLTPPERAVFVLREAFALPYDEIAHILGSSAPACRQIHLRAHRHLAGGRERFHPSRQEGARLLARFLDAAAGGDLTALTRLLAADVVAWSDGGGVVRAARRAITGRRKVSAFWTGLFHKYDTGPRQVVDVNGEAGVRMTIGHQDLVLTVDVNGDHRIRGIYAVLNPVKIGKNS
jgi:RNA polymerase sigma-70 factor, ECF subfamily